MDELVYTVLSQNTADVNTDRSFAALRARFPTWGAVRDADVGLIEEVIAKGGLAHTKAPRLKAILSALSSGGEPDLGLLSSMGDEEAIRYMTALSGVGPKTAACVLLFSLGRPVMPVDTHVYRVSHRLGLIPAGVSVARAHQLLTEMAGPDDPEQVFAAHMHLVHHGRTVCRARRASCGECPLALLCPSASLA